MRTVTLAAPTAAELDGLELDRILGPDAEPYMERHHLGDQVRFHHLLSDDAQPDLHDHPWDFTSALLTGGYREHTPAGARDHWAPALLVRRAEDPHRLELLAGPMWTLVTTGPVRRRWGFHTPAGWVHWSRYPRAGRFDHALGPAPGGPRARRPRQVAPPSRGW